MSMPDLRRDTARAVRRAIDPVHSRGRERRLLERLLRPDNDARFGRLEGDHVQRRAVWRVDPEATTLAHGIAMDACVLAEHAPLRVDHLARPQRLWRAGR